MHSAHQGFSATEKERLEAWLDRIYTDFTGAVADCRGMTREAVHEVAKGRVWTGADAQKHGLIDELGGLRTALAIARERAGLSADAPLRPAVQVRAVAKLRPPMSTDDPRAASIGMNTWAAGWGSFAEVARVADWPVFGPLTMPLIRLG
jgi:protease-4